MDHEDKEVFQVPWAQLEKLDNLAKTVVLDHKENVVFPVSQDFQDPLE